MILNNNFAEHARKLLDPSLPVSAKQQLVTEMRDSIEIVHTSEYGNFLTNLFPAFHQMLANTKPQFSEARLPPDLAPIITQTA
jgi:transformation/transcription domain-associated protein